MSDRATDGDDALRPFSLRWEVKEMGRWWSDSGHPPGYICRRLKRAAGMAVAIAGRLSAVAVGQAVDFLQRGENAVPLVVTAEFQRLVEAEVA